MKVIGLLLALGTAACQHSLTADNTSTHRFIESGVHSSFENRAGEVCPAGYEVVSKFDERPGMSRKAHGKIRC